MGKYCPYIKKDCRDDCVFYRRGWRYYDVPNKSGHGMREEREEFEDCAINVIADSKENLLVRSIAQQKVLEELRNELANMNSLFLTLAQDRLGKLGSK